jgi:hypothetical protein
VVIDLAAVALVIAIAGVLVAVIVKAQVVVVKVLARTVVVSGLKAAAVIAATVVAAAAVPGVLILVWDHAHALNVRVDLEGAGAALDGMKSETVYRAVSGSVRPVGRDATRTF